MTRQKLEDLMTEEMRSKRDFYPHMSENSITYGRCRPKDWFLPRVKDPSALAPDDVQKYLLPEQNPEQVMAMIRQNPWALECALDPTPAMCLEAVRREGLTLMYVEHQTEALCRVAVEGEPDAIAFCHEQTEALCLQAVRKKGVALRLIRPACRTRKVCLEAVKKNGMALEFVPEALKDTEICFAAVRSLPLAFRFCPKREQTQELKALSEAIEPWLT